MFVIQGSGMHKRFFLVLIFGLVFVLVSQQVHAQLINYSRRDKNQQSQSTSILVPVIPITTTETKSEAIVTGLIVAETENGDAPRVKTRQEKRYDLNRDGKLQENEIIAFLKDVITRVETRGLFEFTTNILRPYDLEGDRVIRQYELEKIKQRVAE